MRVTLDRVGFAHRGTAALFAELTCSLEAGLLHAVVGPSGSGKSSFLSLAAGMRQPNSGEISRVGISRVGWVLQTATGMNRRTALDHVVAPFLYRGARRARAQHEAQELLARFGLEAVRDREFRRLSGGEAQRLALARGIAAEPDLLLLDEPTAQLDPAMAGSVRAVIHQLVGPDRIVVLATHDMALAAEADVVLDLGGRDAGA